MDFDAWRLPHLFVFCEKQTEYFQRQKIGIEKFKNAS